MARRKESIAMLLAGGEGKRLGFLTRLMAKPALPFGGKYRIIDFTLSNCTNSGIDTVGVLTQYEPLILNSHIGAGTPWDLDIRSGGAAILPPFVRQDGGKWYKGTADAIYQNFFFVEKYDPSHVLVISGDHIYKMDYDLMLAYHREKKAQVTIAVIEVPWKEASRFGVMSRGEDGRIQEFQEKPAHPRSNLASMGIYFFDKDILKEYLEKDEANPESSNDFGKDVIPLMLKDGLHMYAYPFRGYWKDVGTIESFWEANMDLLSPTSGLNLYDNSWPIYTRNLNQTPLYISQEAKITNSLVNEGCSVYGSVERSVLFYGVHVGKDSIIRDSILMPNVKINEKVVVEKAIIDENTEIGSGSLVSGLQSSREEIILVEENCSILPNSVLRGE